MTARDRYTMRLRCMACQHEGKAHVSEEDGWTYLRGKSLRSIDRLDDGITWSGRHDTDKGQYDDEFHCDCGQKMVQVGWG